MADYIYIAHYTPSSRRGTAGDAAVSARPHSQSVTTCMSDVSAMACSGLRSSFYMLMLRKQIQYGMLLATNF